MTLQKNVVIILSLMLALIFGGLASADNFGAIDHYNRAVDYANEGKSPDGPERDRSRSP